MDCFYIQPWLAQQTLLPRPFYANFELQWYVSLELQREWEVRNFLIRMKELINHKFKCKPLLCNYLFLSIRLFNGLFFLRRVRRLMNFNFKCMKMEKDCSVSLHFLIYMRGLF